MVRERNKTFLRWQPRQPPSGTDNFANLLRDPALVLTQAIARELVERGHTDLRPALLNVASLVGPEGARVTELAERSQLTKATIVRTVDELEKLGYAERAPDPADGRAKLVRLTDRARAVEHDARTIIAELRDEWAAAMAPGDLELLEQLLLKLRHTLWPRQG